MNKQPLLLLTCSFVLYTQISLAEIYKRVDSEGRITYSNVKTADSVRLKIGNDDPPTKPKNTQPEASKSSTSNVSNPTSDYGQISRQTQTSRDQTRKMILTTELESEKNALNQAEQAYQEAEGSPDVYRKRNADGSISTFRNVPKYQAKLEKLKNEVESHQRNIQLLEKELNALN